MIHKKGFCHSSSGNALLNRVLMYARLVPEKYATPSREETLVQVPNAPRRRARVDIRYYEENIMESYFYPEVNHRYEVQEGNLDGIATIWGYTLAKGKLWWMITMT